MQYLVADTTAVLAVGNRRVRIRRGSTVVRDDDPAIKGREHLFKPLQVTYLGARQGETPVETATAEPGEKRTVRRRKTTTESDASEAQS